MKDLSAMSTAELKAYLSECETKRDQFNTVQHSTLLCPYCREVVHFSLFRSHCETIHDIHIPEGITPRYLEERYSTIGGVIWVS